MEHEAPRTVTARIRIPPAEKFLIHNLCGADLGDGLAQESEDNAGVAVHEQHGARPDEACANLRYHRPRPHRRLRKIVASLHACTTIFTLLLL